VRVEGDSLSLRVYALDAIVLPEFVRERLERSIPVTIGRQAELRRERSGWLDAQQAVEIERFRVRRDPWSGAYSASDGTRTFMADSLETIERWLSEMPLRIPLERRWGGHGEVFWIELTTVVLPLTTEDLGEVEYWISDPEEESISLLSIPRGLFGLVRDATGLGDRRSRARSERFSLSIIASDWAWVRPISGSSGTGP